VNWYRVIRSSRAIGLTSPAVHSTGCRWPGRARSAGIVRCRPARTAPGRRCGNAGS
jgi:hypothetical protein